MLSITIDIESKKVLAYITKYTLGLLLISLLIQVSRPSIVIDGNLTYSDLICIVIIFIMGCWVGYTWHNYKIEEQKRKMIWRLLSQREQEVAKLIIQGMNNQEICDTLFIENNTVKTHLRNIYRKSNCSGRKELRDIFNG